MDALSRTKQLIGSNYNILRQSRVLVVGLGGVGSHAAEALARMGIGELTLVDFDSLALSNSNRHVQSRQDRIGMNKAEAMREHILEVLPEARIDVLALRYSDATEDQIFSKPYDFVIDAIDIMTNKLQLIQACIERQLNFVSSMGMANRIDPLQVIATSIYQTQGDRFAATIRRHSRKQGWPDFPVITSTESSSKVIVEGHPSGRHVPASCYLVPAAGGLALASFVINKLTKR